MPDLVIDVKPGLSQIYILRILSMWGLPAFCVFISFSCMDLVGSWAFRGEKQGAGKVGGGGGRDRAVPKNRHILILGYCGVRTKRVVVH